MNTYFDLIIHCKYSYSGEGGISISFAAAIFHSGLEMCHELQLPTNFQTMALLFLKKCN